MNEQPQLVKSKERVSNHGEVFTSKWMVNDMLDLVKDESERIDARVLEPACGEGAFLQEVLHRKLSTVQVRYGKNEFERRNYALLSVMNIYGIELLEDNAQICRDSLMGIFVSFVGSSSGVEEWRDAARAVLAANILQGDALRMVFPSGGALSFPEWGYLGKGKFQRRDFKYQDLTKRSVLGEDTLFGDMEISEIFAPDATFPVMTVAEIARMEVP
jgi:type III restriction system methylase